jgi:trehalose 6-phosphate synthase
VGCAVYRPDGRLIASAKAATEFGESLNGPVRAVLGGQAEALAIVETRGPSVHILVTRLPDEDANTLGVLAVLHDVTYIEERATARLVHFAFWILVLSLLAITLVVGVTWAAYDRPLRNLAEWMRRLRVENVPESPPTGLPVALLASESDRLAASFRAARATGWQHSRESVREHNVWTRDRLRTHAIDCLHGGQLVVVSNREPYMHQLRDGKPRVIVPAGGLVTALDPVLQACGGLWVAHGAGDADRQTADARGRVTVPPGDARYTLRRVWLSREEEQGYYYGLANEGLWPLCHLAHERPTIRATEWEHYVRRCWTTSARAMPPFSCRSISWRSCRNC